MSEFVLPSEEMMSELCQKGMEIYYRLLPMVESEHRDEYIAIHVDSGDYEVGPTMTRASKALRQAHPPDGRVFVRRIGEEPDHSLAARIERGKGMAQARK